MPLFARSSNSGGQYLIVAIRTVVAKTGSKAFFPGNAVFSLKLSAEIAMPRNPNHGSIRIFFLKSGIKSSRAPNPNSQARVGNE